jgi:hypothetical protein
MIRRSKHLKLQRTSNLPNLPDQSNQPNALGARIFHLSHTATRVHRRRPKRRRSLAQRKRRRRMRPTPRSGRLTYPQAKASQATSQTCNCRTQRLPLAHSSQAITATRTRATQSSCTTSRRHQWELERLPVSIRSRFSLASAGRR